MIQLYQERLGRFSQDRDAEEARGLRLGWARLGTFLVGFGLYVAGDLSSGSAGHALSVAAVLVLVGFLALVVWHHRVKVRRRWAEALIRVNEDSISRVRRDWAELPPPPIPEADPSHAYALDIDVCGPASLFRLLTTVTLPPGHSTLREWLLTPAGPEEIRARQEAVAELAPLVELRQSLEAKGRMVESPSSEATERFLRWAEGDAWLPRHVWVLALAWGLPILTTVLIILSLVGVLPGLWWLLPSAAGLGLGGYLRKEIHAELDGASAGQERFGRYAALLTLLLETGVEAPLLRRLKSTVLSSPVGAEKELRRLDRRIGWADVRHNTMVHAPVQAFLMWDAHVLASLERWKKRSGLHVREWLEVLGKLEALSALAALKADNPDWTFPSLLEEAPPRIAAKDLGHPLLSPDQCVRNDLTLGPDGSFLFLTGSNMSGKSTLLRAVGMNAVLAQAGGPVCASAMALTPVRIYTSMRTADSLAEGVSQYMMELKRIQKVVQAARASVGAPVLYLLDEPLQGTNEAERRVAVQIILGHLLDAGAVGAVATHDLQLDETDRLKQAAQAVHLEGTVREEDEGPLLSFDYKLKEGRATSTNALALLRAVGLGEASALREDASRRSPPGLSGPGRPPGPPE